MKVDPLLRLAAQLEPCLRCSTLKQADLSLSLLKAARVIYRFELCQDPNAKYEKFNVKIQPAPPALWLRRDDRRWSVWDVNGLVRELDEMNIVVNDGGGLR